MKHRGWALALCGLTASLSCGCGGNASKGPTGKVTGMVTFQGQPVAVGTVRLYSPKTADTGSATLSERGTFTIGEPLPVGSYKVSVIPPQEPPPEIGKPYEPKTYDNIPEMYRTELTSDISVEIKAGDNAVVIEMRK